MTVDFHPEVPAQVQHVDHVRNGVKVQGGTNWDLSRSALATPIAPMADPQAIRPAGVSDEVLALTPYLPQHKMPGQAPSPVVKFTLNNVALPAHAQKALKSIPRGVSVVVAGHADANEKNPAVLAKKRAEAVAAYLRKTGKQVEAVRSFSDDLPLAQSPLKAQANRRVEVFTSR